ncbi:MAG: family 16 glycoside hydrolase, partial [Planctomycetota bacterium]
AFWNVWMQCLECQVQEGDFGDFFPLAGTSARVPVDPKGNVYAPAGKPAWFGKHSQARSFGGRRRSDEEKPQGEWTRVDVYVLGDAAVHVVEGVVVYALEDAHASLGGERVPLTRGKIQLQSEGAEVSYRDVKLRPITAFPDGIWPEAD